MLVASSAAAQPDAPAPPAPDAPSPPAPDAFPPEAAASPAPAPRAEAPTEEAPQFRDEGLRLGLDLGFTRATTARSDNLSGGTPSLVPLGVDLSFRTSKRLLLGFHGSIALGSRDDCLSADRCIARDYTLGAHFETSFLEGRTIVPFFRYGMGWELLYHGGRLGDDGSHEYRDAFDLVDARLGADFIATRGANGKSTRIGGYLGMLAGIGTGRSGVSGGADAGYGAPGHVWLGLGLRATIDP